jgi:hypothetical protein
MRLVDGDEADVQRREQRCKTVRAFADEALRRYVQEFESPAA